MVSLLLVSSRFTPQAVSFRDSCWTFSFPLLRQVLWMRPARAAGSGGHNARTSERGAPAVGEAGTTGALTHTEWRGRHDQGEGGHGGVTITMTMRKREWARGRCDRDTLDAAHLGTHPAAEDRAVDGCVGGGRVLAPPLPSLRQT